MSGGYDSRLVLASILQYVPPSEVYCYTYGFKGQLDYDIAPAVAKAAGVNYVRCSYDEVNFDVSGFNEFQRQFTFNGAPSYNLIGFYMNMLIASECLNRLGLKADDVQFWSGFLGDRFFAGKWCGRKYEKQSLQEAALFYANWYATPVRSKLVDNLNYDPYRSLLSCYANTKKPKNIGWVEWIDFQQRQYYVKKSLELFVGCDYVYPLACPKLIGILASLDSRKRANRGIVDHFVMSKHEQLFSIPLSNYFGYSIRRSKVMTSLDKYNRLSRKKVDALLGTNLQRYIITPYSTDVIQDTWNDYSTVINGGLSYLENGKYLIPLSNITHEEIKLERATSQLWSSLGYLLKNDPTFMQ